MTGHGQREREQAEREEKYKVKDFISEYCRLFLCVKFSEEDHGWFLFISASLDSFQHKKCAYLFYKYMTHIWE